jgi:hypothetical protein
MGYWGTDPAGRTVLFNFLLEQVAYKGVHKGWYLKLNADGSLDRWGGEFVRDPAMIERVRPPHQELQRQINLAKDKYFQDYNEQVEEDRIRRETFESYCNVVSTLLGAALSLAPGATAIDIETAVSGEDPFAPGCSGVRRATGGVCDGCRSAHCGCDQADSKARHRGREVA